MSPILQRIEHAFGPSIAVDEVEQLLCRCNPGQDDEHSWSLDLSVVRNVQPGAGYRLGNAMRRWAVAELLVAVPPPGDFSGSWFQTFTRSGIGLALARHASLIRVGVDDVTEEIRAYYASKGDSSSTNYGVRTRLQTSALTPDIDRFAAEFVRLARCVRFDVGTLRQSEQRALVGLVFEAVLNVVDHAYEEPWSELEPGLSYISVRHYETLSAKHGEQSGMSSYLSRAKQAAVADHQDICGWMELVVSDDGVGIPARQSRNPDIYLDSTAVEENALVKALKTNESIKLLTRDAVTVGEPGYGYAIIIDALARLGAHAALRTGRRLAELDGTLPGSDGFRLREPRLGWMPGTALHVVLPIRDPQLRVHP
jgi:hypothetical protein